MAADSRSLDELLVHDAFIARHIGVDATARHHMLKALGADTMAELISHAIPHDIRLEGELNLAEPVSELSALTRLRRLMNTNQVMRNHIGTGYYGTVMPAVIARNVLENPGWYTAYTPYQPEIAQGRLEGLLNFQQMVMDMTGMALANASLLDEATAAAEAMALCKRANRKNKSSAFFVADHVFPQTLDVVRTRARWLGLEVIVDSAERLDQYDVFGALLQYPAEDGNVTDLGALIERAHERHVMVAIATDLLALALLKTPGEMGADIALGSAQRFGVPMGFGGPHAAFFAVNDDLKRAMPGRVIGVSRDRHGKPALRMAMQTREQHIRREKATSNICTAQALLANIAGFYAVYHGPEGIRTIATRVHRMACILASGLADSSVSVENEHFFDTLTLRVDKPSALRHRAEAAGHNLRYREDGRVGISLDETTTPEDLEALFTILLGEQHGRDVADIDRELRLAGHQLPEACLRQSDFLTHPTFSRYHSETEMLRYLKRLENRDLSLTHAMIPLGSCTMKLNATSEMVPLSWTECADIHPFAPEEQVSGYMTMIGELGDYLIEVTGYDAISMQPNSGAQGEYAGLLAIRRYQQSIDQGHRHICLIPSSAHGTNPASAAMTSMKVVVVECDANGNIDLNDLQAKAEKHSDELSAIMLTYPSTHGVFEEGIRKACDIVHQHDGQVYIDGANMNAQVGLCRPGDYGGDVSHLNLHKTFCIPHGGGGPGMGPIGVKAHLADYLPGHVHRPGHTHFETGTAVSAAAFGSALILPISWAYIVMMGARGLREASENAILNANYIAHRLSEHYSVLYRGKEGHVAHECIIDIRPLKATSGIDEEDIAKRLMDYGFHAPTMSFPVAGTLMIEPTESESRQELDRFCEAMIAIREEIRAIEQGDAARDNNVLINAPHTQQDLYRDEWPYPYSREQAAFPTQATKSAKFWPSVNRVDNVYGDRNLICSCPSIDDYRD
ncbi:glycine dehydrogenase (decarboxylating) [Kushneria pakistanensis]|uniref:Glycine dehydrogenase (decarboxylating) n=1 Tax=Kushneria pakistanensis TaxID=1508770 RepID=A0ABQ3FEN2_9GAMM|nr:aminomethyl-transferring glycine dehydrogenase [Kushneria pakistanensis]GHC20549.1 glycine dehydrogenase (decarboxylating) [Kushneria pakistanensis]